MVGHPIVHNANAAAVRFHDERFVVLERAEAGVHVVAVRAGVTVVGSPRKVIFHHGCHPNGAHPELFEVPQFGRHPAQVAAMPGVHLSPVHPAFTLAFDVVVVRVAIGKSVRHDEVHRWCGVPRIQSVVRKPRPHVEGDSAQLSLSGRDLQFDVAIFLDPGYVQVDPNVSGQRSFSPTSKGHVFISTLHPFNVSPTWIRGQDLNPTAFQVAPPARRVNGRLTHTCHGTHCDGGQHKPPEEKAIQGNQQHGQKSVHELSHFRWQSCINFVFNAIRFAQSVFFTPIKQPILDETFVLFPCCGLDGVCSLDPNHGHPHCRHDQ